MADSRRTPNITGVAAVPRIGYHCRFITACGSLRDIIRPRFDPVLQVPLYYTGIPPKDSEIAAPSRVATELKYRTFVYWGTLSRKGVKRLTYVYYEVQDP